MNPKMKETLKREDMRDPLKFAPDQYEVYSPSFSQEPLLRVARTARETRIIGKGLYVHEMTAEDKKTARPQRQGRHIESVVDDHDKQEG